MSINLLPWRAQLRRKRGQQFCVMLLLVLLLIVFILTMTHYYLGAEIKKINNENIVVQDKLKALKMSYMKLKQQQEIYLKTNETIRYGLTMIKQNRQLQQLLLLLGKLLPDGVYLREFSKSSAQVTLQGSARTYAQVMAFIKTLESRKIVGKVALKRINNDKRNHDILFILHMDFKS